MSAPQGDVLPQGAPNDARTLRGKEAAAQGARPFVNHDA